ncbi:MAG: class I SAM-dependent methyltransferase [Planctomycetaceae bacterium]|nr:class I SAM-dependent methyltransferase [Planctomycetaceae bacterium]
MVISLGQRGLRRSRLSPAHNNPEVPSANIEMETVPCLLCGGENFEPVIASPDPLTGLGGEFTVVRCLECGLHFTNPRPTEQSIGQFYPSNYSPWGGQEKSPTLRQRLHDALELAVLQTGFGYPAESLSLGDRVKSLVGRAWISRSAQRQNWIPWRGPGRLLDFGCGGGDFLVAMRKFGWQVEGMDNAESCAHDVTQRTGIPVHVGSLPHPEIQPESFDAVTMWNALEHVHQPRETVRAANQALRTGGLLVIGVPNIASWAFEQFRERWYPLKVPRHLTHFTPDTLKETLNAEGFQVLSMDHISRPSFLRKSIRRVIKETGGSLALRLLSTKQGATAVANWTERTGQSEFIRAVAEKLPQ